jgi:RNA recognition motif-containing protein
MRKCGTVLRADVALNPADGRSRGFGVVLFAKAEDAAKAIATYHGYTWQTRVLDVRIDAQDPTGALALAEANRQQALQQHQKQIEHVQQQQRAVAAAAMARQSPSMPPPPPPYIQPGTAFPPPNGSPALVPPSISSPSPLNQPQNGYAAGSSPQLPAQASPALSARNQPLQRTGSEEGSGPTSTLLARTSSQDSRNRSSPVDHSATPTPSSGQHPPINQQPSFRPAGLDRYASDSILPSRLQPLPYEQQGRIPPPPPPPTNDLPPQLQQVLAMQQQQPQQQQQQPVYMPMLSVHPMGYAVPGGMLSYYSSLAAATNGLPRPGSAPPIAPNGYVNLMGGAGAGAGGPPGAGGLQYQNRHLFIGNLPFNCQWQELKDLMRGAGNVLRADIAQGPDGRSRGFGSVLFATPQDAERAVALFNGYEFNGRMLKVSRRSLASRLAQSRQILTRIDVQVHFDKFAGAGVNNQPPSQGPPPPPVYATANGQSSYPNMSMPAPFPHRPALHEHFSSFGSNGSAAGNFSGPSPLSNVMHARPPSRHDESSRPGTASGDSADNAHGSAGQPAGDGSTRNEAAQANGGTEERSHPTPRRRPPFLQDLGGTSSFSRTHHHSTAPSRIAMPPPLPFAALGLNGTPTSGGPGPFSPLGTGGMTPSMPAFTFGGAGPFAAQATPPLVPHGMFSPGVGVAPFSPGAPYFPGTPPLVWSSLTPGGAVTPGHGFEAFNPMFPPTYGYEPMAPPNAHGAAAQQQGEDGSGQASSTGQPLAAETDQPSYFPRVEANGSSSPIVDPVGARPATSPAGERPPRRQGLAPDGAGMPSTAASASAPPLSPQLTARPRVGGHSKSDDAVRPKQNSQAASEGVDEVREVGEALDALRLSGGAEPTGELGWAEGAASPAALPENSSADVRAPEANGRRADVRARRASHDGSAAGGSAKPAAFGTSIWG